MPPRKKKPAQPKPAPKPAAKKAGRKKPAARGKPASPKPAARAGALAFKATDEQGLLAAIRRSPDELTAHLAYADWLTEHDQPTRAAALRAWVAFTRIE